MVIKKNNTFMNQVIARGLYDNLILIKNVY